MAETGGNITIKTGNQDYIDWQAVEEDGTTPISLAAATSATLRLVNRADASVKEFDTTDVPQKFFITDAANGKVELRPAANDFVAAAVYDLEVLVVDSVGQHNIPNDRHYTFKVII